MIIIYNHCFCDYALGLNCLLRHCTEGVDATIFQAFDSKREVQNFKVFRISVICGTVFQ